MSLNTAHEGYNYQDLLTGYFILKEILSGNQNSVFSIDKKNTTGNEVDRFDDLVITNGLDIQRKQIKYSNDTTAKNLIKDYLSADSHYKLALHKLYETWQLLRTDTSEFRLCLAWDDATDNDIKKVLEPLSNTDSSFIGITTKLYKINLDNLWEENPLKFNGWNSLKRYVEENSIDRDDFKKFCDELIIELELPKASLEFNRPGLLESILYEQAKKLGIGQYPNDDIDINRFLTIFAKKISEYRTRSAEISIDAILKDLRVRTDFGKIEQKFEIDQSKNIKDNEKFSLLHDTVIKNRKTIVIGEPGSGKSWFLTNYIDYLKDQSRKVIRHYCFTSTEDDYIEKRVSSDVFFGNLVADIIEEFPHLKEEKDKLYVSDLDELNLLLTHISEDLIVIIDGLDHIERVLKNSASLAEDKTRIINFISQIKAPDNISIILGSQPVDEIKILVDKFEYVEFFIPKWDSDDTIKLMDKFSLENSLMEEKLLSEYVFKKSEGNPLYLTYIIKTLIVQEITVETIEKLPQYDSNLKSYYEYLIGQLENNLIAEILACLEFSVTRVELSELISPWSHHLDNNLKVLSPVVEENTSRGGIKLYHDSFRRFNIERLEEKVSLEGIYQTIISWLNKLGFYENAKSYRHLLSYHAKLNEYEEIKRLATCSFLTESLYHGYSENTIRINYDIFLYTAQKTLDWSLFIFISELNRTIYSTVSEEYHSEFLEKFELYFEAVGLIYGFNKAHELLFYDGKKNYSNEIIAKSFHISQKNGFPPKWNLIEEYYSEEISLDVYPYYIDSLIISGTDLYKHFRTLLVKSYKDFFEIFIKEVYEQLGFLLIQDLFEKLQLNDRNKKLVAIKINNILNSTLCSQRLFVPNNNKKHIVLEELNLDFIDGYIKEDKLNTFYDLVKLYANYNPEALEDFEKTIPSYNFFYNWLKFIIRSFLIEIDMNNNKFSCYSDLESAIVSNFEFLSSDVEAYKGEPRIVDFTYRNSELINLTIEQGLKYIQTQESWGKVIELLNKIPYNTLAIIEDNFLNDKNISYIIDTYEDYDKSEDLNYSEHLEYSFKKAIYYAKIGENKTASEELRKAVYLITGYTFHKDLTLHELIDPLVALENLDHEFALKYSKQLKYLTDAIMKHTDDGKDTRWLTTQWYEEFIKVDYKLATLYLINQFLEKENFWKLDYMFSDYVQNSNSLDSIILNILFHLSPTNSKNDYISHFLDNIHVVSSIDQKLAHKSLINLLIRDLNNSRDSLMKTNEEKIKSLKNTLNINIPLKKKTDEEKTPTTNLNSNLSNQIDNTFNINEFSFRDKTLEEISRYYETLESHSVPDFNKLYFYLKDESNENNESYIKEVLISIIHQKYPRDIDNYYESLRQLTNNLMVSENVKVDLLVNIFVYSKDGWFSPFTNKESLKNAFEINEEETLVVLAKTLSNIFSSLGYGLGSTSNLIIAFEYVGLPKEAILSMYSSAFKMIKYRLPDENDFDWTEVEDSLLVQLNDNELAIVMILSKLKNLDSSIQKEVISSLDYLLKYNDDYLIKPMKWFFENISLFPQITVASILELFSIHLDHNKIFFKKIKVDIEKVSKLHNLYIHNISDELIQRINHAGI